jgi:two-component system, NtrC family, sensor kinase
LQAQILQSEKLASIGQLVGGAAHELNNPITAMLGYSDLLLNTNLTPRQQPLAASIGRDVRRTKSLVASLISFARQGPAPKSAVDLNTLVRTAIKLAQPQLQLLNISVRTEFDKELPKVLGDANQLLQVCLQLLGNCFHREDESTQSLIVRTQAHQELCVLSMVISASRELESAAPATSGDSIENGQGLSACQGIVQEHGGRISVCRTTDGAFSFRVELPSLLPDTARGRDSTLAAPWQVRPFA